MPTTTRSFSYDPQKDPEVQEWISGQTNLSVAIRTLIKDAARSFSQPEHAEQHARSALLDKTLPEHKIDALIDAVASLVDILTQNTRSTTIQHNIPNKRSNDITEVVVEDNGESLPDTLTIGSSTALAKLAAMG